VEPIQEQQPPTRAQSLQTKELDLSDPWELYVYAIKAPATKAKYCQRLRAFLEFLGYEEGSLEDKARAYKIIINCFIRNNRKICLNLSQKSTDSYQIE
jgi:hypothetical protein